MKNSEIGVDEKVTPRALEGSDPNYIVVHSIAASNEQMFGPATIMEYLDVIKEIRDPPPLERDVFVRPSGHYYLTSEYI